MATQCPAMKKNRPAEYEREKLHGPSILARLEVRHRLNACGLNLELVKIFLHVSVQNAVMPTVLVKDIGRLRDVTANLIKQWHQRVYRGDVHAVQGMVMLFCTAFLFFRQRWLILRIVDAARLGYNDWHAARGIP